MWSLSLSELEAEAREHLDPVLYDFFAGGADDEVTARANPAAFAALGLVPRVLRGSGKRDLAVTLLGCPASMPVLIAPTAFHRLAHPDGEVATARAAAAAQVIMMVSMASTVAIEEVVAAARRAAWPQPPQLWFQLYPQPDRGFTEAIIRRAEAAGCRALVVTVDSPVYGHRQRDLRNGFLDLPAELCCENLRTPEAADGWGAVRDIAFCPELSWADFDWLRSTTELPVVVKGVLHPEDARLAVTHGGGAGRDRGGGRAAGALGARRRRGHGGHLGAGDPARRAGPGAGAVRLRFAPGADFGPGTPERRVDMLTIVGTLACLAVVASLPRWLPGIVVALRIRIFARINGENALEVPGELVDVSRFRQVYEHPAANGRSRGAVLSDLFWYWLAPGPHVHQEHLEPGERYTEVARTTRRILAAGHGSAGALATDCTARVLAELGSRRVHQVRLRDLMMPIWAEFYYEFVFGERCPATARTLIVDNADDVVTPLKCCGVRHMNRRDRLTRFLLGRIERGEVPHSLPDGLSLPDKAFYLQGTFFNTAVVQSSEAMAHLLMALAHHPEVQARLLAGPPDGYLDLVIEEALRLYPLFGIAHRITSADIKLDTMRTIPRGSVLCFNYPAFHQAGFDHPERFDPDRWRDVNVREVNHIPFGVGANRPCPARALAPLAMRAAATEILRWFALHSSATHTRSLPNRGPCLLTPRSPGIPVRPPTAALTLMRMHDQWEDVWRGLTQLVLGAYMLRDARRRKLCQRYFEATEPR